ncbi:Uncharacterized protein HZ326_24635 [Fusarium oxysporum f. sp. albedinis]|nr:Uncharacterized protein HZ326_24635 [Fusarium oxysporum f. sp. albedinis]
MPFTKCLVHPSFLSLKLSAYGIFQQGRPKLHPAYSSSEEIQGRWNVSVGVKYVAHGGLSLDLTMCLKRIVIPASGDRNRIRETLVTFDCVPRCCGMSRVVLTTNCTFHDSILRDGLQDTLVFS